MVLARHTFRMDILVARLPRNNLVFLLALRSLSITREHELQYVLSLTGMSYSMLHDEQTLLVS